MSDRSLQTPYTDGYFANERELTVAPNPTFPFIKNPTPDPFTQMYERDFQVLPLGYLPKLRTRTEWTNLLQFSQDLTNAVWTPTNVSVVPDVDADAEVSPDGTGTWDAVTETAVSGEHSVSQAVTVAAATCEASIFVLDVYNRSWIRLSFTDSAATTFSAFFNIVSGYFISPSAGVTARIKAIGDGIFRCAIQFTPAAGAGTFKCNWSTDGATVSYLGVALYGGHFWGAQVMNAAGPTPYVSTVASREISAPMLDPGGDPFAFLVDETDPKLQNSQAATVTRKFCRVPLQQVVPSSVQLSKPALPSGTYPQVYGAYRLFQPDTTLLQYDAYLAKTVTGDTGQPASFYSTGGTYTLTVAGQTTTAINYNANAGAVQSALNALSKVTAAGGVTVTGTYNSAGGFTVTFAALAAFTASAAGLTGSAGTTLGTLINGQTNNYSQRVILQAADNYIPAAFLNSSWYLDNAYYTPVTPLVTNANGILTLSVSTAFNQNFTSSASPYPSRFKITVNGSTTAWLDINSTLAAVTTALNGLGQGTFTVLALPNSVSGDTYWSAYGITYYGFQCYRNTAVTGGTFTVTFGANTTAGIAYNAPAATIAAAINALASVTAVGGVTVTGGLNSNGVIDMVVVFAVSTITGNAGSLTPSGSSVTSTLDTTSSIATLVLLGGSAVRTLTCPGHGITNGQTIYIKGGTVYYAAITAYVVTSVDTINLLITPTTTNYATITEVGPRTKHNYTPGSGNCPANSVTSFYLPGVTPGITTAADIPSILGTSDAATFLQAVFSGVNPIYYQVGQLKPWLGPVLQQTNTTINAADV